MPPVNLFPRTVLVANRGEIACRIIRTLRRLGIRAATVWTDADRDARHVAESDVAVRLESYLDVPGVVAAALAAGATAVHPGYGFLAENAELARACASAGLVFIGPGPEALEIMGDKVRAKAHVARAGVPVVPGTTGHGLSDDDLVRAAGGIGFPVLIKPSAGGGGKGMTVVEHPDDLPEALTAARRMARAAFDDDTLLLERYLPAPRHIEVQVLADAHGTVLHLGERECSLQRRHQKVIEEAPSPMLDAPTRERIGELACTVARSVGYLGAGTVELLVSDDAPEDFFFMEMNTRLQVEHPVTELVTGLDLVEWQVRVAAGEPLTLTQDDVTITGHAIEARLYAEDAARGFLPTTGRVLALAEPDGEGIRVDSALRVGLEVGHTYDPLLAKVIAWGSDRHQALARLDGALAGTAVLGVTTNLAYLRSVLADPDVRAGRLDTGLLERAASPAAHPPSPEHLVAAALWLEPPTAPSGAASPWQRDGWRLGDHAPTRHLLGDDDVEVAVAGPAHDATVRVDGGRPTSARLLRHGPDAATLELDGVAHPVRVALDGERIWVAVAGTTAALRLRSRAARLADELSRLTRGEADAEPEVRSPMPGTVVAVEVTTGDHVTAGQTLLTVEAMKMEHRLTATTDGIVTITARPADLVTLDQVVATITPHTSTPHTIAPHTSTRHSVTPHTGTARPHEGNPG